MNIDNLIFPDPLVDWNNEMKVNTFYQAVETMTHENADDDSQALNVPVSKIDLSNRMIHGYRLL
jgi:hypothetical protein